MHFANHLNFAMPNQGNIFFRGKQITAKSWPAKVNNLGLTLITICAVIISCKNCFWGGGQVTGGKGRERSKQGPPSTTSTRGTTAGHI